MYLTKQLVTSLSRWRLNPPFYLKRLLRKFFKEDLQFLKADRDTYPPGSFEWLVLTEARYGGFQRPVSDKHDLSVQGGDRMTPEYHYYGRCYAEYLEPFVKDSTPINLLEIGILNGSGLAIWCDLFRNSRVIGFDLNLENYNQNLSFLESAGAFSVCRPEVHRFDQLDKEFGSRVLDQMLEGKRLDIVIDDGAHTLASIRTTFEMVHFHLSQQFVYFIEDNYEACNMLQAAFPQYRWAHRGQLTVCRPKVAGDRG